MEAISLTRKFGSSANDFWCYIRRLRANACGLYPYVDGQVAHLNIANVFASRFDELYNSNVTTCEFSNFGHSNVAYRLTVDDIRNGLFRLKPGKADAFRTHLVSQSLKFTTHSYQTRLCEFFNACLFHGYFPNELCNLRFRPLPKPGKSDRSDSGNYRAIATGSLFFKLFEILFLLKFQEKLHSKNNQFGFKADHSTFQCSWVVKEVVSYFLRKSSWVFACFLDCSKAFDLVHHGTLYEVLRARGISGPFLRLLVFAYSNQEAVVDWGGTHSFTFNIKNGVRQGGILSPLFFACYIDEIYDYIQSMSCGMFFGIRYVGVFAYADDLVLLCPSLRGLQKMVDSAVCFATKRGLKFNPDKTQAICFGNPLVKQYPLSISGTAIKWVGKIKHLGSILNNKVSDVEHVQMLINDLYARANALIDVVGSSNRGVLLYLFNHCCMSMYGIAACRYSCSRVPALQVAWNKVVRRFSGLPYRTHTRYLAPITGLTHLSTVMKVRMLKFASTCLCSNNDVVRSVANYACSDYRSVMGENVLTILTNAGVSLNAFRRLPTRNVSSILSNVTDTCYDEHWRIGAILDIISALPGHPDSGILRVVLDYLCCQ
jgi:hypothetical protein